MARKVALHKRDVAVLELLLARRAETLDELHSRYWPERPRKTARNRLGELARAGYLKRESVPLYGSDALTSVYTLGPRAKHALTLRRAQAGEAFRGRRFNPTLRPSSLDHQIVTNRIGDAIGAELHHEHLLPAGGHGDAHRHRPDAIYQAAQPDRHGRSLVFVEVDLGHYTRERLLGKVNAFLDNPRATAIVIASPHLERTQLVNRWIRDHYGEAVLSRVHTFTFDELHAGGYLPDSLTPAKPEQKLDAA